MAERWREGGGEGGREGEGGSKVVVLNVHWNQRCSQNCQLRKRLSPNLRKQVCCVTYHATNSLMLSTTNRRGSTSACHCSVEEDTLSDQRFQALGRTTGVSEKETILFTIRLKEIAWPNMEVANTWFNKG